VALTNLSLRLGALGRADGGVSFASDLDEAKVIRGSALPDVATPWAISNRLADVGDQQQGLTASQMSVAIYRKLVQADPTTFDPHLARALSNLSVRLGKVGQLEDALTAIEESVKIQRRLARANPAAHLPDLPAR